MWKRSANHRVRPLVVHRFDPYAYGMGYEITLIDDSTEQLDADGYALEGPLTTFFRNQPGRAARLDPWSTRIMSVRTERIACIRSREAACLPGLALVG